MTAIAQALSAALLHFVWQGTLLAFLLWITLSMLRNRTANQRYAASCAALALMAAVPALTAWMVYRQPGAVPISAAISAAAPTLIQASIQDAARIARESALLEWMAVCRQWALPVWSVGVLVFALRLVLGCRHVAALRRLGQAAEGQVAEAVALLARRMKAKRAIRVLISSVAESPSVVGWLRPVILLPAATLAGLEPEQLQAVLAHEIAHIRRHDYLVNLAQTMVETLLFYHPAVWWASARIRHERELCCDDAAVAICGDAISYAGKHGRIAAVSHPAAGGREARDGAIEAARNRGAGAGPRVLCDHRALGEGTAVGGAAADRRGMGDHCLVYRRGVTPRPCALSRSYLQRWDSRVRDVGSDARSVRQRSGCAGAQRTAGTAEGSIAIRIAVAVRAWARG